MPQSTVTEKGQTTVPVEIRTALNAPPGAKLEWSLQPDGSAVVRAQPSALKLFGSLKPGRPVVRREEEKAAVAKLIGEQAAKEGRNG